MIEVVKMEDEAKNDKSGWVYDSGESPKKKHGWGKDHAGFVKQGRNLVGKCPKGFKQKIAEQLINDGIVEVEKKWLRQHQKL